MTAPKILHHLLLFAALFISPLLVQPSYGQQAPGLQTAAETQARDRARELSQTKEPASAWINRPGFLAKEFHRLNREECAPIVIDNNLRRPFLFFRDAINQRWPLGRLFFILMLSAGLVKVFAKQMVAGAQERCRQNFLICLASAFIFTTILLSVSRLAFQTDVLAPMALGCIAVVQLSYVVGAGLGVNILANRLSDQICKRLGQDSKVTRKKTLSNWFALIITVISITAISAIPEIGRLPRLGNRLVVLVAIIGLGGLISDMRNKSRSRESE